MTKNINAYARKKGYQVFKVPVREYLPFIGLVTLPTWLTYETEYRSKKGCIYTFFGMAAKVEKWLQKKARKSINDQIKNPYRYGN